MHHELSAYHRERYAAYLRRLHDVARSHGVDGVPFLINLHGTGMGRGQTFPIGISQLSASYAGRAADDVRVRPLPRRADRRERARTCTS